MTNSVYPDEIVLRAQQSDLGLHCLLHLFVSIFYLFKIKFVHILPWLFFKNTFLFKCTKLGIRKSHTVKPVLSGHSKKDQKLFFKTYYRLMQVKNIAECSKGSILQHFWTSLRSLFCLFLSGRLRFDCTFLKSWDITLICCPLDSK